MARPPHADGSPPARRRIPARRAQAALAEAAKAPGTPRKKAAAAGPRAVATPVAADATARLDTLQQVIVDSLENDKAEAVVALDLAGRASFANRMVVATGLADRQITAMATHLEEALEKVGIRRVRIEGANGSDWVLIDAGDIVVHLFKPEARTLYALEKMWAPELDAEADPTGLGTPANDRAAS